MAGYEMRQDSALRRWAGIEGRVGGLRPMVGGAVVDGGAAGKERLDETTAAMARLVRS